jgi:nitronate monooxygenase
MKTRLTTLLGLGSPVIQAPMAFAAGGALAAAVSRAGGLGFIGAGYGDVDWITEQFDIAGQEKVGCGLISWSLAEQPGLLDLVLEREPLAIFLSFGDPAPFADRIRAAGVPLFCQIHTLKDARRALEIGADVVVAQGSEAGGHGETRATMTLVPEVADEIAKSSATTLLCAAGGIADGRGLAASLMLGADGVVVGTRFWTSQEALVDSRLLENAMRHSGDDTIRTTVVDLVREIKWPDRYTGRVVRNQFVDRWHGSEAELVARAEAQKAKWFEAQEAGDTETIAAFIGEAIGLIDDAPPAARIVADIVHQAESLLRSTVSAF